jgi:hypothetical protein
LFDQAALFEAFSIATVSNPLDSLDMTSHVTQHSDHLSVPSPLLLTGAAVTPLELLSSNQATQQSNQLQRHAESTALKNGAHSVLGHLLNMLCEVCLLFEFCYLFCSSSFESVFGLADCADRSVLVCGLGVVVKRLRPRSVAGW